MAQHYMTWATASQAVCGADMTGQRNSRYDTDVEFTTCPRCLNWLERQAEFEASERQAATYDRAAWDGQDS